MSDEWQSLTHRFEVGGHKGYVTAAVGLDGRPLLVEIRMAKAGGPLRGLLEALGAAITVGLQRGVPLGAYAARLAHASFEPSGWTGGELGHARSVVDYVARWLALRFPDAEPAGLPGEAFEGETCRVCGLPATWDPGSPCPECGDIAPPAGGASGRAAAIPIRNARTSLRQCLAWPAVASFQCSIASRCSMARAQCDTQRPLSARPADSISSITFSQSIAARSRRRSASACCSDQL